MSSIDLSDPHIIMAYDALLQNDPLRWFLLGYGPGNTSSKLHLYASGTGDIDELRSHLKSEEISFGQFREHSRGRQLHLALTYIPNFVRGVHRVSALVHGKAVANKLGSYEELTVSELRQVSIEAVRLALRLPPRLSLVINPVNDGVIAGKTKASSPKSKQPIRRKPVPEMYPSIPAAPKEPDHELGSQDVPEFRNFSIDTRISSSQFPSRQEKRKGIIKGSLSGKFPAFGTMNASANILVTNQEDMVVPLSPGILAYMSANIPSPTPPFNSSLVTTSWLTGQQKSLPASPDLLEDTTSRRSGSGDNNESRNKSLSSETVTTAVSRTKTPSLSYRHPSLRIRVKPEAEDSTIRQPQFSVSHREREVKASETMKVSTFKTAPSLPRMSVLLQSTTGRNNGTQSEKTSPSSGSPHSSTDSFSSPYNFQSRFKSPRLSPEKAEEERKLAVLEGERKRRHAEFVLLAKRQREEEEAHERIEEERRTLERLKRIEATLKAEEIRRDIARQRENGLTQQIETGKQEQRAASTLQSEIVEDKPTEQDGMYLISGFITLETGLQWKRRYYQLSTEQWLFYKNDQDLSNPIRTIDLCYVTALREWNQGYEELEAIPNSFAIELQDGSPIMLFADSSVDKEIILCLLNQAARL